MSRIVFALIVLAAPLLTAADSGEAVQKELKALEGKWKAVAGEAGGMPFPKEAVPAFSFVVGPGGKSTGQTPQDELRFTMSVDPRQTPKTIENSHEAGKQKGKKQYGIYKLEGDKFTVCMTPPGKTEADRPKDFSTKDTTNVVFVFERVKDEE